MTNHQQPWLLGTSEQRRLDLSQFYTPAWLAERMWLFSVAAPGGFRLEPGMVVCEPSAGRGSLIRPMFQMPPSRLVAYDVDPRNIVALRELLQGSPMSSELRERDWLGDSDPGPFDLVQQNSPYEDDQDVDHLDHALNHSRAVTALTRSAIVHGQARWKTFWRWADIRRRVNLSERPEFLGPDSKGAKSDFVVLDVRRRQYARRQGEVSTLSEEWW